MAETIISVARVVDSGLDGHGLIDTQAVEIRAIRDCRLYGVPDSARVDGRRALEQHGRADNCAAFSHAHHLDLLEASWCARRLDGTSHAFNHLVSKLDIWGGVLVIVVRDELFVKGEADCDRLGSCARVVRFSVARDAVAPAADCRVHTVRVVHAADQVAQRPAVRSVAGRVRVACACERASGVCAGSIRMAVVAVSSALINVGAVGTVSSVS